MGSVKQRTCQEPHAKSADVWVLVAKDWLAGQQIQNRGQARVGKAVEALRATESAGRAKAEHRSGGIAVRIGETRGKKR